MEAPTAARFAAFDQALLDQGLQVTIRTSRGQDILGACGQLSFIRRPKEDKLKAVGGDEESRE
jgi:adenine C2-methylase RlmN of 23S rRNA A2503 and tRNA A37